MSRKAADVVVDTKTKKQAKQIILKSSERTDVQSRHYTNEVLQNVKVNGPGLKFFKLYSLESKYNWKKILICCMVGVIIGFFASMMVANTGLYNSGLSAITQGIARLVRSSMLARAGEQITDAQKSLINLIFQILFWGLFAVANIPLFIFSWFKIGKRFTYLTLAFVISNAVAGLAFSYLPFNRVGTDNMFWLFGNTSSSYADFVEYGVNINTFVIVENPKYIPGSMVPTYRYITSDDDLIKSFYLLLYSVAFGLITAVTYSMAYIVGGSTGGSDFISIYFSTFKHKDLGKMLIIMNAFCLITGSILGSYLPAGIANHRCFGPEFFFSPNLIFSFLTVLIFGIIVNNVYPINKKVRVDIHSTKIKDIRNHLVRTGFAHPTTIVDVVGGFSKKKRKTLYTICMFVEVQNLIKNINDIDPSAFVSVTPVQGVSGFMHIPKQGSDNITSQDIFIER